MFTSGVRYRFPRSDVLSLSKNIISSKFPTCSILLQIYPSSLLFPISLVVLWYNIILSRFPAVTRSPRMYFYFLIDSCPWCLYISPSGFLSVPLLCIVTVKEVPIALNTILCIRPDGCHRGADGRDCRVPIYR